MKMYEILEISSLYDSIKDIKMPIKTTYKFTKLMRFVEGELNFYQTEFQKIVAEFAVIEDGNYKLSPDGTSVVIIPGREVECNTKLFELRELEVEVKDIAFSLDELAELDISISQLNCLMPLIKE